MAHWGAVVNDATGHVGAVELVEICADMAQRNHALFAGLGAWLRRDDPPLGALARVASEACHRHAEHAALWTSRRPTIGLDPATDVTDATVAVIDGRDAYRTALAAMRSAVADLGERCNEELDPSTRRVVEVVRRDLDSIADRLERTDGA